MNNPIATDPRPIDDLGEMLRDLQRQLKSQTNEHELKQYLDQTLLEFEALYRKGSSDFSSNTITLLKAARACNRALQDFTDISMDIIDVRSKEEALELMHDLHKLSFHFEEIAIRQRIEKEYRELHQRLDDLPSEGITSAEAEKNRRLASLNKEAPKCRKCGSQMVARASQSAAWWACSTFPKCFSRAWLTKKQRQYFEGK